MSGFGVCGPEVFGVGDVADEVGEAFALFAFLVIDEHHVEQQSVYFLVFVRAQDFFGVARLFDASYFHQQDGYVARDAETPQCGLRKSVLCQTALSAVA